jgi:RimJ/RimL family protein N-acetyltransferase
LRFGPDFREVHTLKGGEVVLLRMIRPDDRALLRDAIRRLSPESRYRRFLVPIFEPSEEMLRYLVEVDGVNHVAIVAGMDSLDLKTEEPLGVARFVRLADERNVAEAAVTVGDWFQGRGLGTLLLATLAAAAKERGIDKFRGELLASNAPMREFLEGVGAELHDVGSGTLTFDVALEPHDGPLHRLFREASAKLGDLLRWQPQPSGRKYS